MPTSRLFGPPQCFLQARKYVSKYSGFGFNPYTKKKKKKSIVHFKNMRTIQIQTLDMILCDATGYEKVMNPSEFFILFCARDWFYMYIYKENLGYKTKIK